MREPSNILELVVTLFSVPSAIAYVFFRNSYLFPTFAFLRVLRCVCFVFAVVSAVTGI